MAVTTVENLEFHIVSKEDGAVKSFEKLGDAIKNCMQIMHRLSFSSLIRDLDSVGASAKKATESISEMLNGIQKAAGKGVTLKVHAEGSDLAGKTAEQLLGMGKYEQLDRRLGLLMDKMEKAAAKGKDMQALNAISQAQKVQAQLQEMEKVADGSKLNQNFVQVAKTLAAKVKPAATMILNILKKIGHVAANIVKSVVKLGANLVKSLGRGVLNGAKGLVSFLYNQSGIASFSASLGKLHKALSKFGNVALYRLIRTGIKLVTDALKDGTENAYFFSKQFGTVTQYISQAYDNLSSKSFKMSNQLGGAWSSMIAAIEPILLKLISLVTKAAEATTQFFAILGGKTTYLKAVDYNKAWADSAEQAADAVKEWKNQLMDFDTLNRLNDQSGTSSGSSSKVPDYGNMFVESPINDWFKSIKEAFESGKWKELGETLGKKVNDMINGVDWATHGQNLGKKIAGVIETAYSFLSTVDFKNLGAKIANFINSAGEMVNFETLGRLVTRIRTALWDVLYGGLVSLDWAAWGRRLSDYVKGRLDELADWLETLQPAKIAQALKNFFGNIDYGGIRDSLFRVVKTAWAKAVELKDEIFDEQTKEKIKNGLKNFFSSLKWEEIKTTISTKLSEAWKWIHTKYDEWFPPEKREELKKKMNTWFVTAINNVDWEGLYAVLKYNIQKMIFGEKWTNWDWKTFGRGHGAEVVWGIIEGSESKEGDLTKALNAETVDAVSSASLASAKAAMSGGKYTMSGFLQGLSEKFADIKTFFGGMVTSFSTVGSGLVSSLQSGFSSKWSAFSSVVSNLVSTLTNGISSIVQKAFSGLSSTIGTAVSTASTKLSDLAGKARESISTVLENSKTSLNSIVSGIQGAINGIISKANSILAGLRGRSYATGGFPEDGLFFANHSELVGQFSNGKTAVANNEQIVSGIKQGVYQAVREALGGQSNGNDGQPINVYIGDELVYSGFAKYSKRQQLISGGRA